MESSETAHARRMGNSSQDTGQRRLLWNGYHGLPLSEDGGKKRKTSKKAQVTA